MARIEIDVQSGEVSEHPDAPIALPSKAERIASVNAAYAANLALIDKAWTSANRAGGTSLATKLAAIQADAATLKAQRDADITAIRNS